MSPQEDIKDKPVGQSIVSSDVGMLTIQQVAQFLNLGVSTVRDRDNKGLIPSSWGPRGKLLWCKQELEDWMAQGCPARQRWEQIKQRKRV